MYYVSPPIISFIHTGENERKMSLESAEDLQKLIENPNSSVEDVLSHDYFLQALKQEFKPLLQYISKDSTIKGMAKWIFSESSMSSPQFNKMSSLVVKVFTSSSPQVFMVYLESPVFADVCYSFLSSNDSTNPKLCGFLCFVLSQQVRWGNPKFFKQYSDIGNLLFARMQNLAIQELIVLTASKQSLKIYNDSHLILYLSTIATSLTSDLSRAAIYILLQLYDTLSDESPLLEEFFEPEIVANLFKICLETDSIVIKNDVAAVLTSLYTLDCQLEPNLTKYKDKLLISPNNINPISVAFLPVFNPPFLDVFELFFKPGAHQYLHDYCSKMIMTLSPADINSLAEDSDFVQELLRRHGTAEWCPHMLQISLVLARMTTGCEALHFPQWERFAANEIVPLMRIIENEYGGSPYPSVSQDHNIEEEEEEYYDYYSYDEEESEADIGQNGEMDKSDDDS